MRSQRNRRKPPGQGPQVGHLDSLSGILTEMGCVYREMRFKQIPAGDGTRLIYALRCMRDVIETITLEAIERRLDRMEGLPDHDITSADSPSHLPN